MVFDSYEIGEVVRVLWQPGTALEDCPVGQLIHLAADQDVPEAIRQAIERELAFRAEELASHLGLTMLRLWQLNAVFGGRQDGPQAA